MANVYHPYGNKGGDMIETIKLEKMAESEYLGLGTSKGLPHHAVDTKKGARPGKKPWDGSDGVPVRQPPSQWQKPWGERAWNRPKSAPTMRVHDPAAMQAMLSPPVEPLEAVERSEGAGSPSRVSRSGSPVPERPEAGAAPPGADSQALTRSPSYVSQAASHASRATNPSPAVGPAVGVAAAAARSRPKSAQVAPVGRELLREQQRVQHDRTMRRLRQRQAILAQRAERDFQNACEAHDREAKRYVPKVTEYLKLRKEENARKQASLHRAWETQVFENISSQIQREVVRRSETGEIGHRWRDAQDRYLHAFQSKEAGLFRDIIIEGEYDPMPYAAAGVRYSLKKVRDPVKLELLKAEEEDNAIPGAFTEKRQVGRDTLHPTQWSKIDATPYDSRRWDPSRKAKQNKGHASAGLPLDDYHFERGAKVTDREFPRTKRTFAARR